MNSAVAFDDVAQALAAGGSVVHAAEAHGCLCGAFCARRRYLAAEWLEEVLPEASTAAALSGPLGRLYAQSKGVLADGEMEFSPLLPDDEAALAQRVEALAAWCHGFLYGFGSAGAAVRNAVVDEVAEILADFAEISRAGEADSGADEVEEEAYAQLVEFMRVGVQLVYDQLEATRAGQPAPELPH